MSDFYDISAKMKDLFPSNAEEDRAALTAMANAPVKEDVKVDHINKSVSVKKGSLPIDLDLQSFSKLAGINEKQKDADQVRGSEPTPAMSKPGGNETPHPMKDRLVGDSIENDEESTEGISIVPTGKDPMADLQTQLKRGMDLVSQGSAMIEDAQSKMKEMMSKLSMESKPSVKTSNESTINSIKQELLAKLKASK